jgi:hypothetical protein
MFEEILRPSIFALFVEFPSIEKKENTIHLKENGFL